MDKLQSKIDIYINFNTNNNVQKYTAKIIMFIDKLKLEMDITHARMKKTY